MLIPCEQVSNEQLKITDFIQMSKGRNAYKLAVAYCGFDIETTNVINRETNTKHAYMYHWQFSFNSLMISGRTWTSFKDFLNRIKTVNGLKENARLLVWIANCSFEFQFLRKHFNITNIFAKEERQPLYFTLDGWCECHDCLALTGGNLKQLAKDYTKTQKLSGDLDFDVMRNSTTKLTETELNYCENDVKILSEYSEYVFNKYIIPTHKIPLTKTGILRNKVKQRVPDKKAVKRAMSVLYPTEKEYRIIMNWLFRGGYVHSNVLYTGEILRDVVSVDFTSSYPAVMNHAYFPVSGWKQEKDVSKLDELCNKYCVYFIAEFYNIKTTTLHSIESKNKIIDYRNALFDNGRLVKADYIKVMLCELDYATYKEFMEWEEMNVTYLKYALRGKLPSYLTDVLNEEYITKATLKKSGMKDTTDYALAKANVNSAYGLTVTRMNFTDITYNNGEWGTTTDKFNYYKSVDNSVLSPFFGIWVTAQARRNLLKIVYRIGNDVVYCDTDSIKMINFQKYEYIINEYNEDIRKKNIQLCNENGYDFDIFEDLGQFDKTDGTYSRFKTLGAKRYVTEEQGEYQVTIAGLPKMSLTNYCKENKLDIFEVFTDEMCLTLGDSHKLTTCYNDEETSDYVNGELMHELSSVAMYDIEFNMKLTADYKAFIDMVCAKYTRKKV